MGAPASWVDRARATISAIAASHGHQLEWTADEPRRPGSRLGRYWRADCQSCPVPKSGRTLILPVDASESEDHWLGGPEELIPAYLTRKCRQTREPLTRGPAPKYWTRTHREKQAARQAEFERKRGARARLRSQPDWCLTRVKPAGKLKAQHQSGGREARAPDGNAVCRPVTRATSGKRSPGLEGRHTMTVRNFWLKGRIDGRQTQLEGGPRNRDGGFNQTVYIRSEGGIETGVSIAGQVDSEGQLRLYVQPGSNVKVKRDGKGFTITTDRDEKPKRARRTRSTR